MITTTFADTQHEYSRSKGNCNDLPVGGLSTLILILYYSKLTGSTYDCQECISGAGCELLILGILYPHLAAQCFVNIPNCA